jgi:hypothetical protein
MCKAVIFLNKICTLMKNIYIYLVTIGIKFGNNNLLQIKRFTQKIKL